MKLEKFGACSCCLAVLGLIRASFEALYFVEFSSSTNLILTFFIIVPSNVGHLSLVAVQRVETTPSSSFCFRQPARDPANGVKWNFLRRGVGMLFRQLYLHAVGILYKVLLDGAMLCCWVKHIFRRIAERMDTFSSVIRACHLL